MGAPPRSGSAPPAGAAARAATIPQVPERPLGAVRSARPRRLARPGRALDPYHSTMSALTSPAPLPADRAHRPAAAAPPSSGPTCSRRPSPGSAPRRRRPELVAGLDPPDDAAAWRISPELAVIGTLDFFPPIVDDPCTFGEIAAANALSDVFAMGGRVLFALSIAAFPEDLRRSAPARSLDGASAKVREAGGILAGGHTIRDPEPKYGLAVIGAGHPDRLLRKGAADRATCCSSRSGSGRDCSSAVDARTGRAKPTSTPRSTRCGRSTGPPPRSS